MNCRGQRDSYRGLLHVEGKETGRPLRRLVKRQNVTGLNFFLVEFLLPAEILFSGPVRS